MSPCLCMSHVCCSAMKDRQGKRRNSMSRNTKVVVVGEMCCKRGRCVKEDMLGIGGMGQGRV